MLVDSHCHLNYGNLSDDLEGVLNRAKEAGVGTMLAINARLKEYEDVRAIAETHSHIWASAGIHPHEAEAEPDVELSALLERAAHTKTIGIGETGLDYYYEYAPREAQKSNFRTHIEASRETGLPLIVHTRDAEEDTVAILSEEMGKGAFPGVIHCFTASREFAEFALSIGFYISISGIVTFKSAHDLQETAKIIPLDRLLIETDAPYLAPVPMRGKTCEPAFVKHTAQFLADLRGLSLDDLAEKTSDNFFTLFSKAQRP
ncbi:MAG: TatD family hydrolase [Sphingomonadales bacterium]|jgi:TatD DNase family protein